MNLLMYGTGFIGTALTARLRRDNGRGAHDITFGRCRLEQAAELLAEVSGSDAEWVVNAAGRCGTLNVSWCETHQPQTLLSNVVGAYNLAAACAKAGRRLVQIGSAAFTRETPEARAFTRATRPIS